MTGSEEGRQNGEPGSTDGGCPAGRIPEATMTLWRESIPPDCTAEDSIRSAYDTFPTLGKTAPRFRSLEARGEAPPDFELGQQLGSGGMGVVYAANQTAFNREVAVKMVKPARKGSAAAADALMAEAVVTGHLEHPNVVPVYDLGVDAEGNLFYAMKEVQGAPWSKLIAGKTLDENLDILLRVADTISFAHSRGILHRDLKPHNIMLGEFGETMVMDWGASCVFGGVLQSDTLSAESSFCGTPAYMPPEMARGDINRLGESSDVYLLGAVLYHIIAGHPPRRERDPVHCISLASENHIDPVGSDGELLRIALKAMSTAPADRFSNVRNFQQAICEYRSHSESLLLLENAKVNFGLAKQKQDYDLFNRAIFGFREALQLWPENSDAEGLRIEATLGYARCAFNNADFELAQSLLDPADPIQRELMDLVAKAIRDRDAHKRRNRQLLFTARLLGGVLLLFFALAFFLIRSEQRKTKNEHRQSLVNLISAHYGEQNYEATVASFWELYNQYGMDTLDEESLISVRVAAAMNPWRGAIETGEEDALGIMPASEEDCVWVVGKQELKKVKLTPDAGYDPETLVDVHAFKFGKLKRPGKVAETIRLPFSLKSSAAVYESVDGTLWAGNGSLLCRKEGADWRTVLDVSQLDIPLLSEDGLHNKGHGPEFREWMAATGRTLPITGILLNRSQSRAAVALGGGALCWIDIPAKKCLGWFFVDMETYLKADACEGAPLLELSPDENWLLFREASRGVFAFAFELPGFIRRGCYYGRDHAVRDVGFANNGVFFGLTDWLGMVFAPNKRSFSRSGGLFDAGEPSQWEPEPHETRRLPRRDWALAALNADTLECAVITEDNMLFSGSLHNKRGHDLLMKIASRDWVGCLLPRAGYLVALDKSGLLHSYETHRYSSLIVVLGKRCVGICATPDPDTFHVLVELDNGKNSILKIKQSGTQTPQIEVLVPQTGCQRICSDPQGRYVAGIKTGGIEVFNAKTGEKIRSFPHMWVEDPPVKFDKSGEFLVAGGDWSHWLYIYRTSDWATLVSENLKGYRDVAIEHGLDGERHLLVAREHRLEASRLAAERNAPENLLWKVNSAKSTRFIIPYTDAESGKRRCWLRGWYDEFKSVDLATGGEPSDWNSYWRKKGMERPVYRENIDRVLFPLQEGRMHMVLKMDLLPVADSRIFGEKISAASFNSDGSVLALVKDGELSLMNLFGKTRRSLFPADTPIHYVSKTGSDTWPYTTEDTATRSIHSAIAAAGMGDTVLVDDGHYRIDSQIDPKGGISIVGRNGPGKTIVDGGGKALVFNFTKLENPLTLEGITVTGGQGTYGGGIHISDCSQMLITNCIITGNSAFYCGGGIRISLQGSTNTKIVDCEIRANTAVENRGAGMSIYAHEGGSGEIHLSNCTVGGNQSALPSAGIDIKLLDVESGVSVLIEGCRIVENQSASGIKEGIQEEAPPENCIIRNTVFSGNQAGGEQLPPLGK